MSNSSSFICELFYSQTGQKQQPRVTFFWTQKLIIIRSIKKTRGIKGNKKSSQKEEKAFMVVHVTHDLHA